MENKQVKCGECRHFESFEWKGLDAGYCKLGVKSRDICHRASREHDCPKFEGKDGDKC
jgi:hypothetical protein